MGIDGVLKPKREEILRIARKHGVGRVRVFGSFARGDADESSDLDLLIEVEGPTPPWFPGGGTPPVAFRDGLLNPRMLDSA